MVQSSEAELRAGLQKLQACQVNGKPVNAAASRISKVER